MSDPICSACGGHWTRRHHCLTGPDLLEMREMAGHTQTAVARAWQRSKQYVGQVERMPVPTASTAAAYQAALEKAKETR